MSKNPWGKQLPDLWERASGVCQYCGTFTIPVRLLPELDGAVLSKKQRVVFWMNCVWSVASVDHIVPRSKGGTNHMNNLSLSCVQCNGKRKDKG